MCSGERLGAQQPGVEALLMVPFRLRLILLCTHFIGGAVGIALGIYCVPAGDPDKFLIVCISFLVGQLTGGLVLLVANCIRWVFIGHHWHEGYL